MKHTCPLHRMNLCTVQKGLTMASEQTHGGGGGKTTQIISLLIIVLCPVTIEQDRALQVEFESEY